MTLLKNKKNKNILTITAILLITAVVATLISVTQRKDELKEPIATGATVFESNTVIETEAISETEYIEECYSSETAYEPELTSDEVMPPIETTFDVDYNDIIENIKSGTEEKSDSDKSRPVAKPITEADKKENSGGIIIGNQEGSEPYKYSCGAEKHSCANEYVHATIANLELEGCPQCGSHSCPSFYALNEWGYTRYTPSECPNYNIKDDPIHYCQKCHKPTGNGKDGTCVFYVVDTSCSECGKAVKAWECHSCE